MAWWELIAALAAYCFLAGVAYGPILRCAPRGEDRESVAMLWAGVWPVTLLVLFGRAVGGGVAESPTRRQEREHAEALEEAKHQRELARLKAEEARLIDQCLHPEDYRRGWG